MVRIRLTRVGRKNAPAYRIVVTDRKAKANGKFIEIIGNYNPTENPKEIVYKKDRYDYWTSVGAQPSDSVVKLIKGTYEYVKYDPKAEKAKKDAPAVDVDVKEKAEETTEETKE